MTDIVSGLAEVKDGFDAFVFDQWGVMHQGTSAYPGVADAMRALKAEGKKVAVLSNSGRRTSHSESRLGAMGFGTDCYDALLTSGEAVWQKLSDGSLEPPADGFHVMTQDDSVTRDFTEGLDGSLLSPSFDAAGGVVLLALPDGSSQDSHTELAGRMAERSMPLVCGNPDMHAPAESGLHATPGFVAEIYEGLGGSVSYYGKPHPLVFEQVLGMIGGPEPSRTLMVGDNIATDVAGAHAQGLSTMLVSSLIHAAELERYGILAGVGRIAEERGTRPPDFFSTAAVLGPAG